MIMIYKIVTKIKNLVLVLNSVTTTALIILMINEVNINDYC